MCSVPLQRHPLASGKMKQHNYYDDRSLSVRAYDDIENAFEVAGYSTAHGDIPFYKDLAARAGGLVLDVGTGTGRIAWALVECGHAVLGIDTSVAMLVHAEAKRARHSPEVNARVAFVRQDLANLDLQAVFPLIVVSFRTLNHILEPTEQQKALAALAHHLAPGGSVALHMIGEPVGSEQECAPGGETVLEYAGSGLKLLYRTQKRTIDTVRQIITSAIEYRVSGPDGRVLDESLETLTLRWCTEAEMRGWCADIGLKVEALFGDFSGGTPGRGKEQIWLLRKPN